VILIPLPAQQQQEPQLQQAQQQVTCRNDSVELAALVALRQPTFPASTTAATNTLVLVKGILQV
jgi:hypothetical protein